MIFIHYIKNKAITATNQNFPAKKVHFTCKTKVKEVLSMWDDIYEYLKEQGTYDSVLKAMETYMEQYCIFE